MDRKSQVLADTNSFDEMGTDVHRRWVGNIAIDPMLPEMSESPVVKEYSRLAARYDSRWSKYIDATHRETLNSLECNPGDRVLDVGCGTGILLRMLAQKQPSLRLTGISCWCPPASNLLKRVPTR